MTAALGVALAARVLFAFVFTSWHTSDADQYLDQARAILQGGWVNDLPNGYPLAAAGLLRLAGESRIDSALLILNIALSFATVVFAVMLSRFAASSAVQVTAGAFAAALWPNQLQQVQNFGSDIPAAFFLALAVLLLVRSADADTATARNVAAGLALGLGIVCRPSLAAAAGALFLVLLFARPGRRAVLFLGGIAVPVALVLAFGASRGAGLTLDSHVGEVLANADSSFGGTLVVAGNEMASPAPALAQYVRRLRREPGYFLRQRVAALWEIWGSWPQDNGRGWARQVAVAIRFPLLALAGLGWFINRRNPAAWLIAVPIVALTVLQMMLYALVRFAVPIEPLAIALAIGGLPSGARANS